MVFTHVYDVIMPTDRQTETDIARGRQTDGSSVDLGGEGEHVAAVERWIECRHLIE